MKEEKRLQEQWSSLVFLDDLSADGSSTIRSGEFSAHIQKPTGLASQMEMTSKKHQTFESKGIIPLSPWKWSYFADKRSLSLLKYFWTWLLTFQSFICVSYRSITSWFLFSASGFCSGPPPLRLTWSHLVSLLSRTSLNESTIDSER